MSGKYKRNCESTCSSDASTSESIKDSIVCEKIISTHETDVFKRRCADVFEVHGYKKTQLVILSAGNALYSLFSQSPFSDRKSRPTVNRMIVPNSNEWKNEVERRAHFLACENQGEECNFFDDTRKAAPRPTCWTIQRCQEWLRKADHCINNEEDEKFLRVQIAALSKIVSELNNDDDRDHDDITGNLWEKPGLTYLTAGCRLVHCLASSSVREAFLTRKAPLSRLEKDAIGTDKERKDCWQLMAELYNNPAYLPHSLILPLDDFGPYFVESHVLVPFEKNSVIDAIQFETTYRYLMKEAKIIKSNWEASGNGEEMPAIHLFEDCSSDESDDDCEDDLTDEKCLQRNRKSLKEREVGLDGESAFSKQLVTLDQFERIDFDQLRRSRLQFRARYSNKNDVDNSEKKIPA